MRIPWNKGKKHSEETRRKISEKAKGRKWSEETRYKMLPILRSLPRHPHSLESREKMSLAHKGNKIWLGKKHTEETKKKMSEIAKLRIPRRGWNHTDEAKRRMSKARFQGNTTLNVQGYRVINRKNNRKKLIEHRLLMERLVNRPLKKKEVIHHWNGIRADNQIENLALFRSNSAHIRLHRFADRHGLKIKTLKFNQPWLETQI